MHQDKRSLVRQELDAVTYTKMREKLNKATFQDVVMNIWKNVLMTGHNTNTLNDV